MKTVTCIVMGQERTLGACEIYRCTMPLSYLGKKQWNTQWFFLEHLYHQYLIHGPQVWEKLIQQTDIFVFPRVFSPQQEIADHFKTLFDEIHRAGKRIVYEVDDDYTNEYRHVVDGDAMKIASMTDAITVTTPMLASRMKDFTGKPAYILPNMVDPALWNVEVNRSDDIQNKMTIGLTGSPTHIEDWKVLSGVMQEIAQKYEDVRFVLGGFQPDYLDDTPNVIRLPGVRYDQYAHFIKCFDIVLCPVDPTDKFNDGKSPIKAIEGMAARRTINSQPAGAAVIATQNPVYSLAVQHDRNGLLVDHNPESWKDALEKLITNTDLRHRLQLQGYKDVYKRFNIATGWIEWAKAYNKILSSPLKN